MLSSLQQAAYCYCNEPNRKEGRIWTSQVNMGTPGQLGPIYTTLLCSAVGFKVKLDGTSFVVLE